VENGIRFSSDNSRLDCQPYIYPVCDTNQTRTFDGKCVGKYDCSSACGTTGGERNADLGLCECYNLDSIDNICDRKCRNSLSTTSLSINEWGTISVLITDSAGAITNITSSDLMSSNQVLMDYVSCEVGSECTLLPIEMTNTGQTKGVYGVSTIL